MNIPWISGSYSLTLALAVLTIGLLGSCKKEDPKVSVTGVTLDKPTLEITVGDPDVKLAATVLPENATDKTVSWASDKTEFATVDNQGNVHAVAPGTANITVTTTDGNKTATCVMTVKAAFPEGALSGVFSVSATKKVYFSKGNIVATIDASGAPTAWKFSAHQYDCLGEGGANKTIGTTAGDVDFFGWSTSTNGGTSTTDNYGIKTSTTNSDYSGDFYDWGKAVGDGNTWRTLSEDEWTYLFNTRTVNGGKGAGKSYSLNITYGGKMGVVLYPDDYTGSVLSGTVDSLPEGVVFLPAAGFRYGSDVYGVGELGSYWSSTACGSIDAYSVSFNSSDVHPGYDDYRFSGYNVRLVTEVK